MALGLVLSLAGGTLAAEMSFDLARAMARGDRGVRAVVKRLAGDPFGGRDNGTPESDRAQALLISKLRRLGAGANAAAGDEAYRQPFVQSGQAGTNLLAVIRGRELPDEYVIVGAHYDHLDSRSTRVGRVLDRVRARRGDLPGATDNAAGVGVVLGIGRALAKLPMPPRRSVVLALWDAEEDGLLGLARTTSPSAGAARAHRRLRQPRHPGRQPAARRCAAPASRSAPRPAAARSARSSRTPSPPWASTRCP